ncbi:MAG: hypothetical protein IPP37_03180 [Saprospiraceae bacterium]|nr:hypothetical protein [Saprospiraceae bacterium]
MARSLWQRENWQEGGQSIEYVMVILWKPKQSSITFLFRLENPNGKQAPYCAMNF